MLPKEKIRLVLGTHPSASRRCRTGTPHILWVLACITLLTGCSSGKNTTGTRAYHELTTRYNIYFNAEEAYYKILKEASGNFREDYAELLPLYPYVPATGKPVGGGPFDPVIDKTGKAIREHSITAKPRRDPAKALSQEYRQWLRQEEFNPFLKNVWLLRGKAFLQNGDHDEALSVFSGMLRLFGDDAALADETEIWMLRTYTEAGRIYEAEKIAYTLRNKRLPKHLENLFTEHYTYLLLRKKEFAEAIPYLRKTITPEPGYLQKTRLQFLLGQLYAITGENTKAYQAFEEVKGIRTPFEITLNATLWQSALTSGEQQRKIMRQLHKMEQKVNDADSASLLNRRYQIYLKAGNDSLAQAFKPPLQDSGMEAGTAPAMAAADSTGGDTLDRIGAPQRLSEGRTLAENAALHRQWRVQHGLWQPRTSGSTETEYGQPVPFDPGNSGPHLLLLTFSPGSVDKNRLLFLTADFNFSRFKLRKFNISYIYLPEAEALQIEPFRSFEEASRYAGIMQSDSLFHAAVAVGITPVILSEENLKLIRSGKRMDEYHTFYAEKIVSLEATPGNREAVTDTPERKETPPDTIMTPATIPEREATSAQPEPVQQTEGETLAIPEPAPQTGSKIPAPPRQPQSPQRETPETLKRRLEENAAKALRQQQETAPPKSRKQLLKEREQQRKEKIRQRELELKEKQRKREAELKQRERERTGNRGANATQNKR